jgi:hypothetical protein
MQRDKHRKLAEKVHGSQASVSRQRDKWKVEFYTDAGLSSLHHPLSTDLRLSVLLRQAGSEASGWASDEP